MTGPSGAGKSSLVHELLGSEPGLRFSVSHTTRPRREEEREGVDYRFVSEAEFEAVRAAGGFVEWAEVHGHRYGTSHEELEGALAGGAELLLDIDVQGARQVADRFPDAVTVFILPPDFETLERRLRGRGTERPADLARRLRAADSEVRHYASFRYVVVNESTSPGPRASSGPSSPPSARAPRGAATRPRGSSPRSPAAPGEKAGRQGTPDPQGGTFPPGEPPMKIPDEEPTARAAHRPRRDRQHRRLQGGRDPAASPEGGRRGPGRHDAARGRIRDAAHDADAVRVSRWRWRCSTFRAARTSSTSSWSGARTSCWSLPRRPTSSASSRPGSPTISSRRSTPRSSVPC